MSIPYPGLEISFTSGVLDVEGHDADHEEGEEDWFEHDLLIKISNIILFKSINTI